MPKQYIATIYFTYKGSTPNITVKELEEKLAIAVDNWLDTSDVCVDEVDDEPTTP